MPKYKIRAEETIYAIYETEINADNKKQAKKIARKLKDKKFQVAYHSRLSRSKNTLKEVLKYHPECKKKYVMTE